MPPKDEQTIASCDIYYDNRSMTMIHHINGDANKAIFPPPSTLSTPTATTTSRSSGCDSQQQQQQQQQQKKTNRQGSKKNSVSFNDTLVQIYTIPTTTDLTTEEFEAIYLTEIDYARIKADNLVTLQLMVTNVFPSDDQDNYYFRGLEVQMPKARATRIRRTKRAVNAILKYQKMSGGGGKGNPIGGIEPQIIHTKFTEQYTSDSIHRANLLALWDQVVLNMDNNKKEEEEGKSQQ